MRLLTRRLVLCAAALVVAGAPASAAPEAARPPDRIERELAKRLGGKAPLDDVRVDVRWPGTGGYLSMRLYGRGVLICDGRTQRTVKKETVRGVLRDLRDGGFAGMEAHYGSAGEDEGEEEREREPHEGPALKGSIEVRLGSTAKVVQQFLVGDQSPALETLARRLLAVCRDTTSNGITASSLDDGLAKVASGVLAPETFELILNRRADGKDAASGESFILAVEGRRATDRARPRGQKPPAPRRLLLSAADFTRLVRGLADEKVGEIPINVYADRYTELRVTVLDQSRSVLARKFLNVTPQTHGEKQKAFDRLYETLQALHARVAKEGKAIAPAAPSPSPTEAEREREEREKEKEKEKD
ncbi:MAG TPA: hypothetical protein VGH97_10275 [Thermoanaerobaculia bacterium]|jgi:hypothetical protein